MKAKQIMGLKSVEEQLRLLKKNCNKLTTSDIREMRAFYENEHPILTDPNMDSYFVDSKTINKDGSESVKSHEIKHTKLCIPYAQQIITNKVAFLYGKDLDLILNNDDATDDISKAFKKFKEIWNDDIRMMSVLRKATKDSSIDTRAAIQFMWDNDSKKIKAKVLSEKDGYHLYRHRDDYNKIDAVVVEYSKDMIVNGELKEAVPTTEIWTKDGVNTYYNGDFKNVDFKGNPKMSKPKLMFVFLEQEQPEFFPVMDIINKQDYARSQHSDVNTRIGNPAMVVYGKIAKKPLFNSLNNIYEVTSTSNFDGSNSGTGKMEYLELKSAPESIKMEMTNNERDIYRFTYPDLSTLLSDSNFGNLSGKSIQLMFTQAFVKLAEAKVLHNDVISRSISIIKNLAIDLYPEYKAMKDLKIGFQYNSILPSSDSDNVDMLAVAVSNGLTSKERAIKMLTFNTPDTMKEILKEQLDAAIKKQGSTSSNEDDNTPDLDESSGNERNADGVNK